MKTQIEIDLSWLKSLSQTYKWLFSGIILVWATAILATLGAHPCLVIASATTTLICLVAALFHSLE